MPTLEISTVSRCTLQCTYCPQDKLEAAYRGTHRLSLHDFWCVLEKVPKHVRIDFSGFVEPWLNPKCTSMLEYTLLNGYSVGVYTTLQGMTDPKYVTQVLASYADQVEVVCLHLPDASGNMPGFHPNRAWRRAYDEFMKLNDSGVIKRFETMTMHAEGRVSDVVPFDNLTKFVGVDRAGSLDRRSVAGQPIEDPVLHFGPTTCGFTPFYDQNVMLPNCDVVLCCEDYSLRHPIGNLLRDEWHQLDRGRIHEANMRMHGSTICKRCSRATSYTQKDGNQMWVPS